MKVFKYHSTAALSAENKDSFFLNGKCPYNKDTLCGSWCALFYLSKATENTSAHVILGCKAGEKLLFVEEIVED
jgi:hypothetical protein